MSNCRNCTSKRVYLLGKITAKEIAVNEKTEILKAGDFIKEFSQCHTVPRYSLDGREVIIESCKPLLMKSADVNVSFDSFQVMTAKQARTYISNNILNWRTEDDDEK